MPNFPLSEQVRVYLRNRVGVLANRTLLYAHVDFPLTTAQVQFAVLDEEKINTLNKYIAEGVTTIEKHREIRLAFLREKLPELKRGAVVKLLLPERILVGRATMYGIGKTEFSMDDSSYLVPDLSGILPEQRPELIKWVNRVIRAKRLQQITTHTVGKILSSKITPSVAHLQVLWPQLCTLMVNDKPATPYQADKRFHELWCERFRAPVRPMKMYQPTKETMDKYAKRISAADTVLASGSMLPQFTSDRARISAEIEHWEALEGDLEAG